MRLVTVATCALNQWALDFDGNYQRILRSILIARERGARVRLGPELEICGYGCNDHFYENDTIVHSWEVLGKILAHPNVRDILCNVGMPVLHRGVLYNCRVFFLNGVILLIVPKTVLANDGNYRETRWFQAWIQVDVIEQCSVPTELLPEGHPSTVPFGCAVLDTLDASFAVETCEELFAARNPHVGYALCGVDVILNGSASHHELGKLLTRYRLVHSATSRVGGLYVYSNLLGCDGERIYYDGCPLVMFNGALVCQGTQCSLEEVDLVTATVDLDEIAMFRRSRASWGAQASQSTFPVKVHVQFAVTFSLFLPSCLTPPRELLVHLDGKEMGMALSSWMWDYLRRSGAAGYFLHLSGGLDSSASCCVVYTMCCRLIDAAATCKTILEELRRILQDREYVLTSAKELCHRLLVTAYMSTGNSSTNSRSLARRLASGVNSYHFDFDISSVVLAFTSLFAVTTGRTPAFKAHGGGHAENLALQNIQARVRMVLGYMYGQLTPWLRGLEGSLLIISSSNVDECLRGYITKHDCSAADVCAIGGLNKNDVRLFIQHSSVYLGLQEVLQDVLSAVPTAELQPLQDGVVVQTDESEMGMTYDELSMFGRLRKAAWCGPVQMFTRLLNVWGDHMTPVSIAMKVKSFFYHYSVNRHKSTVLPPTVHIKDYSVDDNRYDLRPFLYRASWLWQFRRIDEIAEVAGQRAACTCSDGGSESSDPDSNVPGLSQGCNDVNNPKF